MGFFGGGGGGSAGIGGSTGATDNAILRADGTGAATLQNSDLNVDDATTTTQNNVAITNQHSGQTNSALVLTPKGTGAFIVGPKPDGTATGGNARGANAIDLQTSRDSNSKIASGVKSGVFAGEGNTASGQWAVVMGGAENFATNSYGATVGGVFNNNTGGRSFIGGGQSNTVNADFACSIGGRNNLSSSTFSTTLGARAIANRQGMIAFSSGRFSEDGSSQGFFVVLRCKTTTNAAVEMGLEDNGGTSYLTIPSGKVIFCNIRVVGVKSDGSAVATYERQYAAKNVTGTSSEVYAPVTIGTDNAASTSLSVSVVDAGDYISIKPTGITSETWRWTAVVEGVEVFYGT
jgi:hypothetical protein